MKRVIFVALLLGVALGCTRAPIRPKPPAGWILFKPHGCGFSVNLPREPAEGRTNWTPNMKVGKKWSVNDELIAYKILYVEFTKVRGSDREKLSAYVTGFERSFARERILTTNSTDISVRGKPGHRSEFIFPDSVSEIMVVVEQDDVYRILFVAGPSGQLDGVKPKAFLDSFEVE